MSPLLQAAREAVALGRSLGADEVKAHVAKATQVDLQQRDGSLERCTEASTLSLSLSLMVDERSSSHSTSDLRPEALRAFVQRAVDGTRYLEPDPLRAMLPREAMGSLDPASLDLVDEASFASRTTHDLRAQVAELEQRFRDNAPEDRVSSTAYLWELQSEAASVFSNGFEGSRAMTNFGWGGSMTVKEPGGKLPEAYAVVHGTHLADVPDSAAVTADLLERIAMARDTRPTKSGVYPMILDNRVAGRILGALLGPLGGMSLHEKRSMYLDRLGTRVAATGLTIVDDPTIPRALGSRPFDGDGLLAEPRPIIEAGVLSTYFLDVYHARKLGMAPTTGGPSNVVIAPGARSWQDIARALPRAIRVTSFLGGNSNGTSGDFSFGIRGQLLEHGQWAGNLSEMNISGNLLDLADRFVEADDSPWLYSSYRVPTLVFDGVQFSGS